MAQPSLVVPTGSWTGWARGPAAPSAGGPSRAPATAWPPCTPTCWTAGTGPPMPPSRLRPCCPPAAARCVHLPLSILIFSSLSRLTPCCPPAAARCVHAQVVTLTSLTLNPLMSDALLLSSCRKAHLCTPLKPQTLGPEFLMPDTLLLDKVRSFALGTRRSGP